MCMHQSDTVLNYLREIIFSPREYFVPSEVVFGESSSDNIKSSKGLK